MDSEADNENQDVDLGDAPLPEAAVMAVVETKRSLCRFA